MLKKFLLIVFTLILISPIYILLSNKEKKMENKIEPIKESLESENNYTSDLIIEIIDVDGNNQNFIFTYKDEEFKATYTKDNWKIIDSYKITNKNDITKICESLIKIHPIHSADMESFRTAEDLANEWIQHNLAYNILSEESKWKESAKDVDLNPSDEGKSLKEMYEDRTGKKINIFKK